MRVSQSRKCYDNISKHNIECQKLLTTLEIFNIRLYGRGPRSDYGLYMMSILGIRKQYHAYTTSRPHVIHHNTLPCNTIPYHTIPYHTIPYHTIPYHTIPYHTIPYHTIPYHTIPYHTIPYDIIQSGDMCNLYRKVFLSILPNSN